MKAYNHPLYKDDVRAVAALPLEWEKFDGKRILISGATGLLGSCLVDVLFARMDLGGLRCEVHALGRNENRARERFAGYWERPEFHFVAHDINEAYSDGLRYDYVIHLASNTHPVAYATEPVSTVMTNISGLKNMLDLAVSGGEGVRFAFASSNEVYGENRGDVELFDESYCGYIDSNTLRAGYPESKRCGEALCQAYAREYGLDVLIPRFTRSFGPTLLPTDTKALSQFLRNAVAGEDIVLKSEGRQFYSYTYVTDAVSGLLYVLLRGESGLAYNIADESFDITLRDLASAIARIAGTSVVFDHPSAVESAGFSKATKARLDGARLRALGWSPLTTLPLALQHTIAAMK